MNEKKIVNIIFKIGLLGIVSFLMIFGLTLTVLASSTSTNSTSTSTNSTATDTRPSFNVTNLISTPQFWMFIGIGGVLFGIFIGILAYRMLKLREFPVMSVTHGDSYKRKKVGRLTNHERASEIFPYWKFDFKKELDAMNMQNIARERPREGISEQSSQKEVSETSTQKGISEQSSRKIRKDYTRIYGKDHLSEMRGSRWAQWNLGVTRLEFFPHYYLDTITLPPALWFKEKVIKNTRKNVMIYYLFKIFFKAKFIHKYLEFEDSEYYVKEIQIFQHEHKKERTYFVFHTTFEKREFYKEQGITAWVRYPEMEIVSLVEGKDEVYRDQIEAAKEKYNSQTPKKKPLKTKEGKNPEITEDLIKKYEFILAKLKEQKLILEDKVERGYLKEKDLLYYKTIFEIEDMRRMESRYRKVKRHGDPITIQTEVRDLIESIKRPQDVRELISHEELKSMALLKDLKESQQREQEQRERNNELALTIEKRAEELLEGWERDRDERVKEKFEHSIHALKLKRKYGFNDKEALIEATKLQMETDLQKDTKIQQLEKKVAKLTAISSDLIEKNDSMTISLASPEKRTIRSKQDLEKIINENGGK